jgi:hypothetical protein
VANAAIHTRTIRKATTIVMIIFAFFRIP